MIPEHAHSDYSKWIQHYQDETKTIKHANKLFKEAQLRQIHLIAYRNSKNQKEYLSLVNEMKKYYNLGQNTNHKSGNAFNLFASSICSCILYVFGLGVCCLLKEYKIRIFIVFACLGCFFIMVLSVIHYLTHSK
jgi:hypothetical protein